MPVSEKIVRAMREHDTVEVISPLRNRRAIRSARQALDEFGKVVPDAAKGLRLPYAPSFTIGSNIRWRCPRAGTVTLIASHADTPPTTGNLIIRIYAETSGSGQSQIYTLYSPKGSRIFEQRIKPGLEILAGTWLSVDIQSAGGASSVTVSLVVDVG